MIFYTVGGGLMQRSWGDDLVFHSFQGCYRGCAGREGVPLRVLTDWGAGRRDKTPPITIYLD